MKNSLAAGSSGSMPDSGSAKADAKTLAMDNAHEQHDPEELN